MSAEKVIYGLLSTDGALTAIVPAARIYPQNLPQNATLPALSYWLVGADEVYSLQGPSGYVKSRIQIDAWGVTFPQVLTILSHVRRILGGYRGTIAGVTVQALIVQGRGDIIDDQEQILVEKLFHRTMDVVVHYNE